MAMIDQIHTFTPMSRGQELVIDDVLRALGAHFAPAAWVVEAGGELPADLADADAATLSLDDALHRDGPVVNDRGTRETVSWTYRGMFYRRVFGVAPSGQFVVIRGTTVLELDRTPPLLHRFVDWLDVLASMGLPPAGRPLATDAMIANLDATAGWLVARFRAATDPATGCRPQATDERPVRVSSVLHQAKETVAAGQPA